MSIPQEHDYIGLSEPFPIEKISKNEKNSILNLKETELRLGLPGSESPERKIGNGVSIFGKDLKNYGSGAKRGFCDAINGCGNWILSVNGGSEVNLVEGEHVLFSPVKEACKNPPGEEKKNGGGVAAPSSKAQVVGWPPVRSFRKNSFATNLSKNGDITGKSGPRCLFVKVIMDGAPYLRKIDLNTYCSYAQLSPALDEMFSCFTIGQYGHGVSGKEHLSESRLIDLLHGSEYVLTYEDKDGDWMLVGDVPWEMFIDSCKRLRIMKGSDAIGLAPRTMLKYKSQN